MRESGELASSRCAATEAAWGFDTATLVLAGGAGKRMGGYKPNRMLGGQTLLDFALDAARQCGGVIALGIRSSAQIVASELVHIEDRADIEGPLASLAAGLSWAQARGAGFLQTVPCDAPFLPRDLSARLHACLSASRSRCALPISAGRLHPTCGLWRTDAASDLGAYLDSGRRSLLGFAEHVGFVSESWGQPARDPFFNVNTPADLAQAEAWLTQPHLE